MIRAAVLVAGCCGAHALLASGLVIADVAPPLVAAAVALAMALFAARRPRSARAPSDEEPAGCRS